MNRKLMATVVVAACAGTVLAEVRPAAVFTDGAVLQAHRPVPVWGKADPGESVKVSYGSNVKTATADAKGDWRVDLAPMDYVREGKDLVVGDKVFRDVLVGEVWLGIGQSNMEYPFDLCKDGKEISKGGVIPTTVRYFHMPKDGAEQPRDLFGIPKGVKWLAYTAENRHANEQSSGLLALFAQRLTAALDVPVGVIGAAVGGANLETWMSNDAVVEAGMVEEHAKYMKIVEGWHQNNIKRWENRPESEKNRPFPKVNYESRPQQVYNAMIPPLAPYALSGIFYYQGEMNSGWQKYEKQFPYMVKHIRKAFETTDQPFFVIQLPDYKENHWVKIRDIHRQMSETLPRSGLVVTIDGHEMQLHPSDKGFVADRMVGLALTDCYGKTLLSRSPAPVRAEQTGSRVVVTFKNAGDGLRLSDGDVPRTFELADAAGKSQAVVARLVNADQVELVVPADLKPATVRYAWSADPDVNLVNAAGLPATPFEIAVVPASDLFANPKGEIVEIWPKDKVPLVCTNQTYAPYMEFFKPAEVTTDAFLIVAPGGGYGGVAYSGEGYPVVEYFMKKGMNMALLKYRTPRPIGKPMYLSAWQDVQRAIRVARDQAIARGYSPDKIGVMGFSAGGHLTLMAATSSLTPAYEPVDALDRLSCSPNWAVPVYPAYVLEKDQADRLVPEFKFDAATPRMCLLHGDADGFPAINSDSVYRKLRSMKIAAELHTFVYGDHVFFRRAHVEDPAAAWLDTVWRWLYATGVRTIHPSAEEPPWKRVIWGPIEKIGTYEKGAWTRGPQDELVAFKDSPFWLADEYATFEADFEYRLGDGPWIRKTVRVRPENLWVAQNDTLVYNGPHRASVDLFPFVRKPGKGICEQGPLGLAPQRDGQQLTLRILRLRK